MFKVKICGVRLKSDVDAVAAAGGDAIGLNFYPHSIRYLAPAAPTTRDLSLHAEKRKLLRIGVFVNVAAEQAGRIAEQVGLDAIQLHGDESIDVASELVRLGWKVIRAIKLPVKDLSSEVICKLSQPWSDAGCQLLLDADAGKDHGGSGQCLDWPVVAQWAQQQPDQNWTLAGGLNAENVGQAIAESGARSVDTASGVERPRGSKSPEQIEAFVAASLNAMAQ